MNAKKNRRRLWLWTAVVSGFVVGLYACGGGLGFSLISDQQEVEIGTGVDQEIEGTYAIVNDNDPVAVWARDLVRPLETASTAWRDPADIGGFKVEVIADDELVNAFAAPGGFTYISTGLILQATTCAEIAGVMSHELTHVTERHSVKNIEEAYGVSVVTSWFLGEGLATEVIGGLYSFLQSTTYSQEHEAEADDVGLQIAYAAGYNPYGLVDFFEKLLALSGGASVPTFLSSHPATQDRINDTGQKIQQLYGSKVVRGSTQTYDCMNTSLQLADVQAAIRAGVSIR